MFVREKTINGYTYLYLVENIRESGRTRQHIIRNLGRKDAVLAAGDLDRLIASIGRFSERAMVLNAIDANPAHMRSIWSREVSKQHKQRPSRVIRSSSEPN